MTAAHRAICVVSVIIGMLMLDRFTWRGKPVLRPQRLNYVHVDRRLDAREFEGALQPVGDWRPYATASLAGAAQGVGEATRAARGAGAA